VTAYESEVIVDAVALGDGVDPDHVVVAGGGDHGVDRPAGDTERAALDRGPFGIEPAIADDESARLDHRLARTPALRTVPGQRGGIEESLGDGAAVDMHLLVGL